MLSDNTHLSKRTCEYTQNIKDYNKHYNKQVKSWLDKNDIDYAYFGLHYSMVFVALVLKLPFCLYKAGILKTNYFKLLNLVSSLYISLVIYLYNSFADALSHLWSSDIFFNSFPPETLMYKKMRNKLLVLDTCALLYVPSI